MFDMMNKPLLDMNEVSPTISPSPSPQLTLQLTFQLIDEYGNTLINLSPNLLMKWLKGETLASISTK